MFALMGVTGQVGGAVADNLMSKNPHRPSSLLRRFATPEEVAAVVVCVSTPRASATNGSALRVDGGVVRSIV